jgi:hypothetical protein
MNSLKQCIGKLKVTGIAHYRINELNIINADRLYDRALIFSEPKKTEEFQC